MSGWIKLHRKIADNSIWLSEPFTRGQAWVDLIILANFKGGYFYKRGNKIDYIRGQVTISIKGLADRWQWSRKKATKFLNDLEKDAQIEQQKSRLTTLISIVNYEKYQIEGATEDTTEAQQKHNRGTHLKKEKNDKKDKKEPKSVFVLPDWVNQELWDGFINERKKLKASNSDAALKALVTKLSKFREQGFDPNESISTSLENSWKGVFEPKQQATKKFNLTEALKNDMQRITEREMDNGPVCEVKGYLHG